MAGIKTRSVPSHAKILGIVRRGSIRGTKKGGIKLTVVRGNSASDSFELSGENGQRGKKKKSDRL